MADGVLKKGVDSGALTVDMGYAVAQGDGLEALFQPTVAIDDGAGYQPGRHERRRFPCRFARR